jgi:hypothetical protein
MGKNRLPNMRFLADCPNVLVGQRLRLDLFLGGKMPHGLHHEGPASEKVLFHKRVKSVQETLGDPSVVLNSFIVSWTPSYQLLDWGLSREELETMHMLFMIDDRDRYIEKLFAMIR